MELPDKKKEDEQAPNYSDRGELDLRRGLVQRGGSEFGNAPSPLTDWLSEKVYRVEKDRAELYAAGFGQRCGSGDTRARGGNGVAPVRLGLHGGKEGKEWESGEAVARSCRCTVCPDLTSGLVAGVPARVRPRYN
jgi:hypothetical protein